MYLLGIQSLPLALPHTKLQLIKLLLWLQSPLNTGDSVTQTQCNPLSLRSNPYVACELAIIIFLLLHRYIDKSIFPKHAVIRKNEAANH
jgi:hypothetical protein